MHFRIFILLFILIGCSGKDPINVKANADRFKQGTFEIPAGENYSKTKIIRKDSLQIEYYENRVDTLVITWRNNFNYELKMLNPGKNDEDIIFVQIKKIKSNSYLFEAKIGYSNFIQNGELFIAKP